MTSTLDLANACKTGDMTLIKKAYELSPEKINEKDTQVTSTQLGWSPLFRTVVSNNIEASCFLLQNGADPNISNNFGETPLHIASDSGNYTLVSVLLEFGADVNHLQNDGETPLHRSAFDGKEEIIRVLLEHGGNPNSKTTSVLFTQIERTPLHYAVDYDRLDCVKLLMQYGADPSLKDKSGRTAFDLTEKPQMLSVLRSEKDLLEFEDPRVSYTADKIKSIASQGLGSSSLKQTIEPILDWLEKCYLAEHYETFVSLGYSSLDALIKNSEEASEKLGQWLTKPGHRKRFLNNNT